MRALLRTLALLAIAPACSAVGDDGADDGDPSEVDDLGETDDAPPDQGAEHVPGAILSDPVDVCDGGDGLRLAALVGMGGNVSPVASVVDQNGSTFLYLDGRCRYWVSGGPGQALTGTLGGDEVDLLTSRLGVEAWAEFEEGEWIGDSIDGPPLVLWRPSGRVVCHEFCKGARLPAPLSQFSDALAVEVERLAAGAQPLDGPMRAYGLAGARPEDEPTFEWTYQPDVAEFSYTDAEGNAGVDPALIADPTAATALRAAWARAREEGAFYLTVSDEAGALYRVFARDVLPFEKDDAWGGVELP